MMAKNVGLVLAGMFLLVILGSVFASAEMGEIAGQPSFNVSLGGSQTLNVVLLNSGSDAINFDVVLPVLNVIPNTTTPTVTAYPLYGTIAPHASYRVAITAYVPSSKNKPGTTWTGVMQFVQASNSTNPGGAVLQVGVAKILTITAAKPVFPQIYILVAVLVFAGVGIGAHYVITRMRSKKAAKKAVKKGARKAAKRTRKKGKKTVRKRSTRTRRTTRRRARR